MDCHDGVLPFIRHNKVANSVTFFGKSNQKTLSSTEPVHCFSSIRKCCKNIIFINYGQAVDDS